MFDMGYLSKFIPCAQMSLIRENIGLYKSELSRLQGQIRACPQPHEVWGQQPSDIRIYLHHFGGATDFWVYAIEDNLKYGEAFVLLNNDSQNAETGPIRIADLLPVAFLNADLYWNTATTLKEVMEKVKE